MDGQARSAKSRRERESAAVYEPPRVELVVTASDLEREVLYAGIPV